MTVIEPLRAAAGTVVEIWVAESTVKVALAPANATAVTPVKFVPVIVTGVPAAPAVGLKLVIVGAGIEVTVKLEALVAVPPGVVTLIGPVVDAGGTVVAIRVGVTTEKRWRSSR